MIQKKKRGKSEGGSKENKKQIEAKQQTPALGIKWGNLRVTIRNIRDLKSGMTFLYLAAFLDLLGAIAIVVKGIKDTYWVWVVLTFVLLLFFSIAFIVVIIQIAASMQIPEGEI